MARSTNLELDSAPPDASHAVVPEPGAGRPGLADIVQEWRTNWRAGLASALGTGTGLSVWPTVSSLFVQPLQSEFGWTRSQVVFAYNASIAVAISAPFLGRLIDRVGIRRVLLWTIPLTALGYVGLSLLTRSLSLFYALYLFTTTIGLCTSGLGFSRVASAAFHKTRGLALAVSRFGLGLSAAILPPALFVLIAHAGWRSGFVLLAALLVLVTLPVTYLLVGRSGPDKPLVVQNETVLVPTWSTLLRQRRVWLLCLAAALSFAPAVSILQQLQPILTNKAIAPVQAAALIGVMGFSTVSGTFITGALIDRIWAPLVAVLFTLGPALGCLLLLPAQILPGTATTAIVCLGLAQGAEFDLVAYMIARYFGMHSYATIYGITTFFIAGGCAVYANLLGRLYDHFGNYERGILLCALSLGVAGLCYVGMGSYPSRPIDHE